MMKIKKHVSLLMAVLMVATLFGCTQPAAPSTSSQPQSGNTDSGIATIQEGKLIVGTSADFPPYEFHALINGQDKIMGFDMDLAQAIADDLGLELVIRDMSFDSILMELQNGMIDIAISGISPDPERALSMNFSDAYYTGGQYLMIRKADAGKYTSFASLKGLSVGAQSGSIQEDLAKEHTPESQLVSLATIPNLIMELKSGKIEAAYIEEAVAQGYLLAHDDLMLAFEVPYNVQGNAVAIKKGDEAMTAAVNATIKRLQESGELAKLIDDASALAVSTLDQAAG